MKGLLKAIISQKTGLQRKTREVGMMSMLEDLAGERLKIRPTSSNVTGDSVSSTEPQWEGNDKSLGTDTDNECNVSLTESRSLTILSTK